MTSPSSDEVRAELEAWLAEQWDPDLTVRQWWRRMVDGRWTAPTLPAETGGRGWPHDLALLVRQVLAEHKVLGPPEGIGLALAAPTIARCGTPEQVDRFLPPIVAGEQLWCQLFSEPDAGSDLAGMTTRAEADGDEWRITGRKVWTSQAHYADWGILLARSDLDQPKHRGLTFFALPMDQPGVDVRPLRELTGEAFFNEVFLDDARVPAGCVIGPEGDGWRVALTTLAEERHSLGSGAAPGAAQALPGPRAGHLDRRAGEMAASPSTQSGMGIDQDTFRQLLMLADSLGRRNDPSVRLGLARLWEQLELNRLCGERARAGKVTVAEGNLAKLRVAQLFREAREVGNEIIGPWGTIDGADTPGAGFVQRLTLFSPAPAIYGGTDQIQRNIIAERALGLPRDDGPPPDTPFRQLLAGQQILAGRPGAR